jgi:hypothetical protein
MGIFLGDKPVSVYFNGASASLPVQGVFLGGIQVFPTGTAAATLYFNDAEEDGLWTTVGNWWLDDEFSEPAGRLPTSADSVVATESIVASGQTVVDFTLSGSDKTLSGTLTVTGMATFDGSSSNQSTVNGNATFNDSSRNDDTVTGNATFNDSSSNGGTVAGNATFNDGSSNDGTVTGNATFNDSSTNNGTVTGTITDNT